MTLKKGIVILIIISSFFGLFLFGKNIREIFYQASSSFQRTIWTAGQGINSIFLQDETLRKENNILLRERGNLALCREENRELKNALDIELDKEFNLIFSEIVGKKVSENTIILNKGGKDGALKNMPVVTGEKVLAGKVSKVYNNFSEVSLLTGEEFVFDLLIGDDVSAMGKGSSFEMVLPEDEVKEGDIVLTSGLGGIFPKGLLVGRISSVIKNDADFYTKGEIEPSFRLKAANYLFIIEKPVYAD